MNAKNSTNSNKLGIIFDVDGVLIDSGELHFQAFVKMGQELGLPFTREMLVRTMGMHNNQIFPLWLQRTCSEHELKTFADKKEAFYRDIARTQLQAIPGVVTLIEKLVDHGFRLAVGSSGPVENVNLALETIGVRKHFHTVITGSDVREGKPNPEIFLKGAAGLNIDSKLCLVFEDAITGVQAARNAEMSVIAITTTAPRDLLTKADLIIDHFDEVTPIYCSNLIKGKI